jgi:hypothetical protein
MNINQNIKLPTKGRKALACSKEELIEVFTNKLKKELKEDYDDEAELEEEVNDSYLPCDAYNTMEKIHDDCDIDFDLENCFYGWQEEGEPTLKEAITTINVDGKEVPVIPMMAGGDWEQPVYFICYLDDKMKIRFFSPKPGNTFNPLPNEVFGNDDEKDDEFARTLGMDDYGEMQFNLKPDIDLMKKAVQARLIAC